MLDYAYWTISNTVAIVVISSAVLLFAGYVLSELQHLKNKQKNLKG